MFEQLFTGSVKIGRKYEYTAAFTTREEARDCAFTLNPKAKEVSTGYGYHGSFGIIWHRRGEQSQIIRDWENS